MCQKLADYLSASKTTDATFAREIGVHSSTVMRLKRGERKPSIALAERIMSATNGFVQPNDFMSRAA